LFFLECLLCEHHQLQVSLSGPDQKISSNLPSEGNR
jgi:hypothetical protein